ncbi:hypothetical protein QAD02_011522 [Eretmocerus hayati]|uniref:Uncharacterized protein n=1 Tax=Eretmocerus hayati TaxID=131215 RepID=A0ACC2NY60_9HYME|nr:hypothetical protein QAD02_011522 [Eretmocerus hayati]
MVRLLDSHQMHMKPDVSCFLSIPSGHTHNELCFQSQNLGVLIDYKSRPNDKRRIVTQKNFEMRESGKHRHRPRSRLGLVRRTSSGRELLSQDSDTTVDGFLGSSTPHHSGRIRKQAPKLNNVLKVQLVRLESICSDYNELPAGAIEQFTEDYMSNLFTSKSTRGTWQTPINYHQLRLDRDAQDAQSSVSDNGDNDDGNDYDASDSERLYLVTDPEPKDRQTLNEESSKTIDTEMAEGASPSKSRKTPTKKKTMPKKSPFENLIKALRQQEENAAVRKELPEDEPQSTESLVNEHKSPEKVMVNGNSPEKVMVNGNVFLACQNCNKIFTGKHLFDKHQQEAHRDVLESEADVSTEGASSIAPSASSLATSATSGSTASKKDGKQAKKDKKRKILRPFVSDTKCTICAAEFESKDALFHHIMKHNGEELNQAYETEKKKLEERRKSAEERRKSAATSDASSDESDSDDKTKKAKKNKPVKRKSTDSLRSSVEIEILEERRPDQEDRPSNAGAVLISNMPGLPPHPQSAEPTQNEAMANIQLAPVEQRPVVICACHANESTNQDLQIEMVLTCKVCHVVFRRRECFEVHFRSSPDCRQFRTNNENTKVPRLFCSGCPLILDSLVLMRAHLEHHAQSNSQGTVTFMCNICKVAFFGVGTIFYQHWYSHAKSPDFVASRYSFPKLSIVSVLEENYALLPNNKSRDGYFYIAEHVCRTCRLPFSSEPELTRHQEQPCQSLTAAQQPADPSDPNAPQFFKLICDLCKKYYVSKESFDRHCLERKHLKTQLVKCSRVPIGINEAAFVCGLCRAAKNNIIDMNEHWRRIHSPTMELYTCKTCNMVPTSDPMNYTYERFERHCKAVHKNELVNCLVYYVTARYHCAKCKYGFENERTLNEHKLMHARQQTQKGSGGSKAGKSTQLPNGASVVIPPQTPTMWVAEDQVQADGGRRVFPIYHNGNVGTVNSNINGIVNGVVNGIVNGQVSQNDSATVTSMPSNGVLVQSAPGAVALNQVNGIALQASTESPQIIRAPISNSAANNKMLRTMLINNANQQLQQNTTQQVETIDLDSRSNSPILDSANGPAVTTNPIPLPTLIPISSASIQTSNSAPKQSYMTSVNPEFDSMIGSEVTQSGDNASTSNAATNDALNLSESTSTIQPFEIVLLNDDASDNSNGIDVLASDETNAEVSIPKPQPVEQPPPQPRRESSETKSFLRVRSVAELQSIKIHECKICDLSFEKLEVYEQHMIQHQSVQEPQQLQQPLIPPSQPLQQTHQQQYRQLNGTDPPTQIIQPNVTLNRNSTTADLIRHLRRNINNAKYNSLQRVNMSKETRWYNTANGTNTPSPPVPSVPQRNLPQLVPRRSTEKPVSQLDRRAPPPPYQANAAQANRSGAIHLPERSNATPNSSKRPSGAATRIPQSLPSFESFRQAVSCSFRTTSPYMLQTHEFSHQARSQNSSASPNQISTIQSKVQQMQLQQQAQPYQQQFQQTQSQQLQQQPLLQQSLVQNQYQQQLQNRAPIKQHVAVSQMPTRPATSVNRAVPQMVPENQYHPCNQCGLVCNSQAELVQHVTVTHTATETAPMCCFVCDYCPSPILFDSETALRKHMNHRHNYPCDICNSRYPSKEDLSLHQEVHSRNT